MQLRGWDHLIDSLVFKSNSKSVLFIQTLTEKGFYPVPFIKPAFPHPRASPSLEAISMLEMKVAGIALDAVTRSPIVLLRDSSDRRQLPIYIGQDQARAIISALENQTPPRPLTHDLMVNLMDEWDLELERVVIHSLQDNTFFAILTLRKGELKKELDARPSDAIALALRTNSPIWVMEEVVADASMPVDRDADEAERQAFKDFLENLRPDDLIQRSPFNKSSQEE